MSWMFKQFYICISVIRRIKMVLNGTQTVTKVIIDTDVGKMPHSGLNMVSLRSDT